MAVRRAVGIVIVESMQVGDVEAAREEIAGAVQAMGWAAAEAAIMGVVQAMVGEGVESASITLGADLGELQVAILWAAHAVVVDVHRVLASQFGELQQERPAVGAVHLQQAGSGPEEVLSTASRAEQATESSSSVEVEVTAVSPAKIAAHLEAAAESSSTGGGSSGVAEALSAEAAEMQQAAAEGEEM